MDSATAKRPDSVRWKNCKKIQQILLEQKICEVTATDINNSLYTALMDAGYLTEVLNSSVEYLELLRKLPEYERMISVKRAKASRPKLYKPKKRTYTEDIIDEPSQQINVAMWLIKKLGGVEQAKKALEAAIAALDKLQ